MLNISRFAKIPDEPINRISGMVPHESSSSGSSSESSSDTEDSEEERRNKQLKQLEKEVCQKIKTFFTMKNNIMMNLFSPETSDVSQ